MSDKLLTLRSCLFGHDNKTLATPSDPSWTREAAIALAASVRHVHGLMPEVEWMQALWILRASQLAQEFTGLDALKAWVAMLEPCVSPSMLHRAAFGLQPIVCSARPASGAADTGAPPSGVNAPIGNNDTPNPAPSSTLPNPANPLCPMSSALPPSSASISLAHIAFDAPSGSTGYGAPDHCIYTTISAPPSYQPLGNNPPYAPSSSTRQDPPVLSPMNIPPTFALASHSYQATPAPTSSCNSAHSSLLQSSISSHPFVHHTNSQPVTANHLSATPSVVSVIPPQSAPRSVMPNLPVHPFFRQSAAGSKRKGSEAQRGSLPVRLPTFKRTPKSKRTLPIAILSQPVRTSGEIKKFMEMALEYGPGAKLPFEDMAKSWNASVLTELMSQPKDNSTMIFPHKTLKTARQLQKYHGTVAKRIDLEFSRMAMSSQPKLARATIQSFASSGAASSLDTNLQQGIDRSGSTGADDWAATMTDLGGMVGQLPGPSHPAGTGLFNSTARSHIPARSGHSMAVERPKGVGKGGNGGEKTCQLCKHIDGVTVGIKGGHKDSCEYQKKLKVVKDVTSSASDAAAAYSELDRALRETERGERSTMLTLYPALKM